MPSKRDFRDTPVSSTDRCNTFRELLSRRLIEQGLSRPFIELPCDGTELCLAVQGQIGAMRSTGAVICWCFRLTRAAREIEDHKNRRRPPWPMSGVDGRQVPCLCPRSTNGKARRATLRLLDQCRDDAFGILVRYLDQHHVARMALDKRCDIAIFRSPIRSPSQWPGTARSSTDAGRSLMDTASLICPSPFRFMLACLDRRTVRLALRCSRSSFFSTPRA